MNDDYEKMVTLLLCALGLCMIAMVWATKAHASEIWYAVTVRCQQTTDVCTKRQTAHISEDRCNLAIERRAEMIGETDDVVISFCMTREVTAL